MICSTTVFHIWRTFKFIFLSLVYIWGNMESVFCNWWIFLRLGTFTDTFCYRSSPVRLWLRQREVVCRFLPSSLSSYQQKWSIFSNFHRVIKPFVEKNHCQLSSCDIGSNLLNKKIFKHLYKRHTHKRTHQCDFI